MPACLQADMLASYRRVFKILPHKTALAPLLGMRYHPQKVRHRWQHSTQSTFSVGTNGASRRRFAASLVLQKHT